LTESKLRKTSVYLDLQDSTTLLVWRPNKQYKPAPLQVYPYTCLQVTILPLPQQLQEKSVSSQGIWAP
jgi:hypothetical protein